MIGFILGTSEGKEILSLMNEFTNEIVVSTATKYGGTLLSKFKVKHINTKPLDKKGFICLIERFNINVLVDASHPYAQEVSKTAIDACKEVNIDYIRYERKSYCDYLENNKNIIKIESYNDLKNTLKNIDGNVLNTTGSNNVELIEGLNLKNRVIHRVLPSITVLEKLIEVGVPIKNIIAIQGPFGYALNDGLIKEYKIRALITKDSGIEGGTKEKIDAAIDNDVKVIVLNKPKINYGKVFQDISTMIDFLKENYN